MKQVTEKKKKVVQNLQDLIVSCKRSGQVFNLQTPVFVSACTGGPDGCRCDGRNLPKL